MKCVHWSFLPLAKKCLLFIAYWVCDVCFMLFSSPVDQKKLLALEGGPKTLLPKPSQSGLRPPGFSHLPPARLAAFGFVRSASVSSVSSNQSTDSTHSDPCRSANRESCRVSLLSTCICRAEWSVETCLKAAWVIPVTVVAILQVLFRLSSYWQE